MEYAVSPCLYFIVTVSVSRTFLRYLALNMGGRTGSRNGGTVTALRKFVTIFVHSPINIILADNFLFRFRLPNFV